MAGCWNSSAAANGSTGLLIFDTSNFQTGKPFMLHEHNRQVLQEAVRNFYLKSCGRHRQAIGHGVRTVGTGERFDGSDMTG